MGDCARATLAIRCGQTVVLIIACQAVIAVAQQTSGGPARKQKSVFAAAESKSVPRVARTAGAPCTDCGPIQEIFDGCETSEGYWQWHGDPLQARRRTVRIYNLQCVRCHGVNGRGVWDIPDVPDFTGARWQMSRSDADIVRLTLGGRGACMPAFRGTISYQEAWAIAKYIRTFCKTPAERPGSPAEVIAPPQVTNSPTEQLRQNSQRALRSRSARSASQRK